MRVLITGGNGFIGSVVVRKLMQQNYQVRCLLRTTSKTDRIADLKFEQAIGDVRDVASISAAMVDCQAVVHLASLSNWNDINSPKMDEIVIGGTRNILNCAAKIPAMKVLCVSSAAAINGSSSPQIFNESSECTLDLKRYSYARAKRAAEGLCRDAHNKGLSVVMVNPGEVYGPHDTDLITSANLIDFHKSSPVLTCSGGTSVVYVEDVADGIISALFEGKSGERYILGGENLTITELATLSLKIMGQKKRIVQLPNWVLQGAGKIASACHIKFPIHPAVIPYATLYWMMDNSKAKNELGIRFRDAEETLTPTIRWLQQFGYI